MQSFDAFKVGDTVYKPRVHHKRVPVTCPDCNDQRTWRVMSATDEFTITCPRCEGGKYDFQQPHRTELTLDIEETQVIEVTIRQRENYKAPGVGTWIDYTLKGHGSGSQDSVFATRDLAQARGEEMLAKHAAEEDQRWAKERERIVKYAGETLMRVLIEKANVSKNELETKLDDLKERFLEAIRDPGWSGPKIKRAYSGALGEITSEAMAEWLNGIFSEANLDGWSEEEIHEATCHC